MGGDQSSPSPPMTLSHRGFGGKRATIGFVFIFGVARADENAIGTAFLVLVVVTACYDVAVDAGENVVSVHTFVLSLSLNNRLTA
jgi:hypothetical protein